MNNVMPTGNLSIRKHRGLYVGLACAVIFVILVLVCAAPPGLIYLYFENLRVIREAQDNLTRLHGSEVTRAIEKFERTWFSLDVYRNSAIQGEVATASMIEREGVERLADAERTDWYVKASASVTAIRVLEFDPAHFKSVACVNFEWARASKDGGVLEKEPARLHERFYVFVREDENWKAATFLDITFRDEARRAWEQSMPEWEKQMIGEFPHGMYPSCWGPTPVSP